MMKLFALIKKELTALRNLVTDARYSVFGQDELRMCHLRLRLQMPGEKIDEKTESYVLSALQVPQEFRAYEHLIVCYVYDSNQ